MPHLTEEQWNEKLARLETSGKIWSDVKWRSTPVIRQYVSPIVNGDLESHRGQAYRNEFTWPVPERNGNKC